MRLLCSYTSRVIGISLIISLFLPLIHIEFVFAKNNSLNKAVTGPAGTILLPISPKLDYIPNDSSATNPLTDDKSIGDSGKSNIMEGSNVDKPDDVNLVTEVSAEGKAPAETSIDESNAKSAADAIKAHEPLKASVQIVADDTEFDEAKNTFLGTGNAVAIIGEQDSKLEADMILYNQDSQMMDARGNVKILRNGQLTTGSAFKFKVTSDEYLITNPDTELQGSEIIARKAFGNKDGLSFKDGSVEMPQTIFFSKNTMNGPYTYGQDVPARLTHPEAFVPAQPSFVFKARKMVYERYKEGNNLTIFGGKLAFKHFTLPLGKLITTMGGSEGRTVMSVMPYLGNNLYVGGTSIGPTFNTAIGKTGVVSWAPLIQLGGASLANTSNTHGTAMGVGTQVSFTNQKISTHLAYGSVSNVTVADFKYKIWRGLRFQAGLNRFLNNGMFGAQRAHLIGELVDNHNITKIPFISMVNIRSSAGWAQDNPQLVNLSPQFAKLFGSPTSTVVTSAFRLQEQIRATSAPIFNIGDDKYGINGMVQGGLVGRAYSTGDKQLIGMGTPMLNISLNRVKLMTGYSLASVHGSTPFVFDQYYMGAKSTFVSGSVKVNRYLDLGGYYGYNLTQKLPYAETITAAIGPEDFKLILSHDVVFGYSRVGLGVIYGQPVQFNKMIVKGNPDRGQLGGI